MKVSATMFCIEGFVMFADAAVTLSEASTAGMLSRSTVALIAITASVVPSSAPFAGAWCKPRNVTDCTGCLATCTTWMGPWSRRRDAAVLLPTVVFSMRAAFQWSHSTSSNMLEWFASSAERSNLTPVKVMLMANELVVPTLIGSGVGDGAGAVVVVGASVVVGATVVVVGATVVVGGAAVVV